MVKGRRCRNKKTMQVETAMESSARFPLMWTVDFLPQFEQMPLLSLGDVELQMKPSR
jgi:hypothetical protein